VTARRDDRDEYLFVLNHGEKDRLVAVPSWPETVVGPPGPAGQARVAAGDLAVRRRPATRAGGRRAGAGR
jgi:Beta-galactosidase C-terminal domain